MAQPAASIPTDAYATIEPPFLMTPRDSRWSYEIRVALPLDYATNPRPLPILWVTDGSHSFDDTVSLVFGSLGALPPTIIVAVGVPRALKADFQARRSLDFRTGTEFRFTDIEGPGRGLLEQKRRPQAAASKMADPGKSGPWTAEKFLGFLVDEVRPRIMQRYRAQDNHTLAGFSGGGNFCLYTLFKRPEAYSRYICASPAVNGERGALFKLEEQYAAEHTDLPVRLFLSAGEGEITQGNIISGYGIVSSTARMAEILRLRNYPSLRLQTRILPGAVHNSAGRNQSLYEALRSMADPPPPAR